MQRRRLIVLLSLVASALLRGDARDGAAHGATVAASESAAVAEKFERPVSLTWQGVPLADALDRLAESESLHFWIDRRVDRSAPVAVSAVDQRLAAILTAVATQRGAGFAPFVKVVYFGPVETADELATLAALGRQQLAKAPAAVRMRWLKPQAWSYPRLSKPRELLEQLAAEAGAKVDGAERVPHDLWPAGNVPAMAPLDRMVLLLAGFDLAARISADGSRVEVVPIERPVHLTREYRVPPARAGEVQTLLNTMPDVKQTEKGSRVTIAARAEEHQQLQAVIAGKPTVAASKPISAPMARNGRQRPEPEVPNEKRFTLKIENQPLAPVLNQLATQLGLELVWDEELPDAAAERNALVSCQVEQVDANGLLTALLGNAGLAFERDGNRVLIRRR